MALHGATFCASATRTEQSFVQSLRAAAGEITLRELTVLLEGEYRARLTAAFLAGIGRRARLRDLIGANLLDSEFVYAGQGYCFALANFGTHADAVLLVRRPRCSLTRTDVFLGMHNVSVRHRVFQQQCR